MGVNICVYKVQNEPWDAERVPKEEWDYIRQGADRDFKFETECVYNSDPEPYNGFILSRPVDLDAEKTSIQSRFHPDYTERYYKLIELLRANPDYYVHWSY